MRAVAIGIIGLALIGPAVAAEPALTGGACVQALKTLQDEWQAVGYPMPMKPAQAQVMGRDGQVATSGQVNYLRGQIRRASQDCEGGNDASALQRIADVRSRLETARDRQEPGAISRR
ncbi:MAG: hypothetical protein ACLQJR_09520 [Stellaceae bacterium]